MDGASSSTEAKLADWEQHVARNCLAAVEQSPDAVRGNRQVMLRAVQLRPAALIQASDELKADTEFMCSAVQLQGSALKYAPEEAQADQKVVLAAVASWAPALKFAAPALRSDRDFVMKAVGCDGLALQYADERLQRDEKLVLVALHSNGDALQYAHEELRANKDVVMVAVKKSGLALRAAAPHLRDDPALQRLASMVAENRDSAVTKGRADEVFEGRVIPGMPCIVSFPGAFLIQWDSLVKRCREGSLSSACVFLPKSDKKKRFGKHEYFHETPDRCYCHTIYGKEKPWGCRWFVDWVDNVKEAVSKGLKLLVVFFPDETSKGIVEWADLHQQGEELWNGVGLGGSQKAEVAWLRREKLPFSSIDVKEVNSMLGLAGSKVEVLDVRRPSKGDFVKIVDGAHAGKRGQVVEDEGDTAQQPFRIKLDGEPKKWWFKATAVALDPNKGAVQPH